MPDFTSALYLGLHHGRDDLTSWSALSTGRPAALQPPPGSRAVANGLGDLMGCAAATLAPSTLHLFWDLFGMLAGGRVAIYLDSGAYPIARWGVERAAARRVPVRVFGHYDTDALIARLRRDAGTNRRPLVVTDGFCPRCGRNAPLGPYLDAVRTRGGLLILDDTQALGILGAAPTSSAPYGKGGGGSLRWWGIDGPDIVSIASLAKAFGVPLAVLGGSRLTVDWFEARSQTRMHSSPPAIPLLLAAWHALGVNRTDGDRLRWILASRVARLRRGFAASGLAVRGGHFPVQHLAQVPGLDVVALHRRLWGLGVRTVLLSHKGAPEIVLLTTARHSAADIDGTVRAISRLVHGRRASAAVNRWRGDS